MVTTITMFSFLPTTLPVIRAVENIQQPAPVPKVPSAHPVVIVMSLGGSEPGEVKPRVIIELVQGDDQVPEPGGAQVGPDKDGTK